MTVVIHFEGVQHTVTDLFQTVGDLKKIISEKVGKPVTVLKRLNSEEELKDTDNRFVLGGFVKMPIFLKAY